MDFMEQGYAQIWIWLPVDTTCNLLISWKLIHLHAKNTKVKTLQIIVKPEV